MGIFNDIAGIKVGPAPVDDFQERVKLLKEYYENLVKHLNETALKLTPYIRFAIPDHSQVYDLAGKINNVKFFKDEFEKIFPQQIRSAWEVIVSLINGKTQEHVTGLTQLGKNGLITVLLDFLGIVAYAREKNKNQDECPKFLVPVAWLPNAINMERQSIKKFGQSMLLNGIVKCHIGKEVISLKDCHNAVTENLQQTIVKTIESRHDIKNTDKTKFKMEIAEFFQKNDSGSSALVLRRSTSRSMSKFYHWLFEGAKPSNKKIVLVMDESHIAIGEDQAADDILKKTFSSDSKKQDILAIDEQQVELDIEKDSNAADEREVNLSVGKEKAEIIDILNTYKAIFNDEAKLITVSATNTAFLVNGWKKGDEPVYLEVSSGYCGFKFVDGRDYPSNEGVITAEPLVKPIKEIAKEFKLPDLELLNLKTLDSAVGFGLYMMDKDWLKICEILNENMVTICSKLDVKITGDFGPPSKGWIRRAAKVLGAISGSKSTAVKALFKEVLDNCGMMEFLDKNEFTHLFTNKTEVQRKNYLMYLVDNKKPSRLQVGWEDAIKKAQNSLGDLLEYLLITTNPQNKKGCILRWECWNRSYNKFILNLESRFKNKIIFIPYFGESAKSTVSDLLKKSNSGNLPYLITVTGRGRYGESYPRDCGYAIDCTTKPSTAHSFFQSLLGRLTGYGKYDPKNIEGTRPLLILSDFAYEKTFLELKNGKGYSSKVGTGKNLLKTGLDFKPIEIVCVDRGPKELDLLFQSLDENLDASLSYQQIRQQNKVDLFKFIEPYCDLIEKYPEKFLIIPTNLPSDILENSGLKILRPGDKVDDYKARELDWIGNNTPGQKRPKDARIYPEFEAQTEKYKDGSRKFGRLQTEINNKGKQFLRIGFQFDEAKTKVQSVFLWLKKPIDSPVTGPSSGAVTNAPGSVPGVLRKK